MEDLKPVLASILRDIFGNPFRPVTCGWRTVKAASDMSAAALESGASEESVWFGDWQITRTVLDLAEVAYGIGQCHCKKRGILCAACGGSGQVAFNPAVLPMLADALEDAGCTDQDILCHLRSDRCDDCPVPPTSLHVRGCWAVDLVLGKV